MSSTTNERTLTDRLLNPQDGDTPFMAVDRLPKFHYELDGFVLYRQYEGEYSHQREIYAVMLDPSLRDRFIVKLRQYLGKDDEFSVCRAQLIRLLIDNDTLSVQQIPVEVRRQRMYNEALILIAEYANGVVREGSRGF
ncbi:hypothetical protein KDA23_00630 [Candidatus Saccharibacteria bacterium]|nr:hypothetical protein [Candidatus Saccharibacteria bacterium]